MTAFYRGMMDAEAHLLEDDYLSMHVSPKYIVFESSFRVLFELQIYNKNEHELFVMLPSVSEDPQIQIANKAIFNGVSKIASLETAEFKLEAEVSIENLPKFAPIVLSFFACFEQELGSVFANRNVAVEHWRKKVVLPVNILKFVDSVQSPDFGKIGDMKLASEVLVNNQTLLLNDISSMFPNLSISAFRANRKTSSASTVWTTSWRRRNGTVQ